MFYKDNQEMPYETLLRECGKLARDAQLEAFVVYKQPLSSGKSRCWLCSDVELRDSSQKEAEVHWIEEVDSSLLTKCEDLNKKMAPGDGQSQWQRAKDIQRICKPDDEQCYRDQCSALQVHLKEIATDEQGLQCVAETGSAPVRIHLTPKKAVTSTGASEFICA